MNRIFLKFREEIFGMIDSRNWQELEDAFFKVLEFGTAGRRGKVGAGSNRINYDRRKRSSFS